MLLFLAAALVAVTAPVPASTPDAMAQSLTDAKAACRKASNLRNAATLGATVIFSDTTGKTAMLVTGFWRSAHMQGARATMLCLYDRASRSAEVQEANGWTEPQP